MLELIVEPQEYFDEASFTFVSLRMPCTLQLEHSLISISKWESIFKKPFLNKSSSDKSNEEILKYIECMTINKVDPDVYHFLTQEHYTTILAYIEDPHTATTISDRSKKRGNKEQITAELIYYWMIALTIPWETQKWHINRLLTLIQVCNIKNDPKANKMSKREVMQNNASLNAQRKAAMKTKG